ncbi:serine/threonine-protein kinase 32A-like isoform X2 [Convolutriloba macropyga]
MGCVCSKLESEYSLGEEVDLSHFQILRSIGRGAFGKVCIVKKVDTDKFYAMKYMNKKVCQQNKAVDYVCREQQILMALSHSFIVNLWYAFQDQEDMFMVVELFRGGDLRFHIDSKNAQFDKHTLKIYALEIGLALDYLKSKGVVHRDIKPDNILLDENGHLALTDFNVAAVCAPDRRLHTVAGTKCYMAPELLETTVRTSKSYGFEVDWWSTGVTLYETYRRHNPFQLPSNATLPEVYKLVKSMEVKYSDWDSDFAEVIKAMLEVSPRHRVSSCEDLNKMKFFGGMRREEVLNKLVRPTFVPSDKKLNCNPTFELEEMIMETEPLHKKKKRLKEMEQNNAFNSEADTQIFSKYVNFDRMKDWKTDVQLVDNELLKQDTVPAPQLAVPEPKRPVSPGSVNSNGEACNTGESKREKENGENRKRTSSERRGTTKVHEKDVEYTRDTNKDHD